MSDRTTRGVDATTHGLAVSEGPRIEAPGQIGPFKILRRIGEGGFGVVFEAEQEQPVKRRVALKVIKLGMDSREVIARFESERQALALMDHPHIARVLDAGATDGGRPYFVMEFVEGAPMSSYCDAQKLTVSARLSLFDQVCLAVQHAHTKGVIHRDLKPGNVLVSSVDGRHFAKVIDFGIAKAASGRLTDRTLLTELHQVMGTPLYMSPEQAAGSADIDTRTDIYSLGVLLYELLTGTTPVDAASLRAASLTEFQRLICEVEPPRPSLRLSRAPATLSELAARRATEPRKLTRMIQGELDWIVMKALEKDRGRRYETANALAMDVRRYLAAEPVLAAPPSASYRLQKFVRRHKGAVAAGSLVAVSLLVGIAAFAWQARIAKARAAELEQVSRFQAAMLEQVDPTRAGKLLSEDVRAKFQAALVEAGVPEAEQARQAAAFDGQWRRVNATDAARDLIDRTILTPAADAIDRQFKDQPAVDATLRQALAYRYWYLGLYDKASPLQAQALATRRRVLGEEHPDTLASIHQTGLLLLDQGKLSEAEASFREALQKQRHVLGEEHVDTLASLNDVGYVLRAEGKLGEAEPYFREALQISRRLPGRDHEQALTAINNMGGLLQDQGKPDQAEPYFREALERNRRVNGDEHANTLTAINNMGVVLQIQGKLGEAEPYYREALAKRLRALGEEHPDTLQSINNIGALLTARGKLGEAESLFREASEKCRRLLGPQHDQTLYAIHSMGVVLREEGKLSEAEPYVREALAQRRALGEEHAGTISSMVSLGQLLQGQGKPTEAEPYLREAVEKSRRALGDEHSVTLLSIRAMGSLLVAQGKHAEAAQLLSPFEAATRKVSTGDNSRRLASFLTALGKARTSLRDFSAAETSLLEAHSIYVKASGPTHKDTRECVLALVELYSSWHAADGSRGFAGKAVDWKAKL